MGNELPIIDISALFGAGAGTDGERRVAAELERPCNEWGVFHVVGHDIGSEDLRAFEAAMTRFFDLMPTEKKSVVRTRQNARGYYDEELTKNQRDWKEVFDYGVEYARGEAPAHSDGRNQWPEAAPEIMAPLLRHYDSCERVGLMLLRAICVSLGVPRNSLDAHFAKRASFVRLNRYSPCPDPAPADAPLFPERGRLGVYHHTDAGALTLLFQDDVAGLQVEKNGEFFLVEPIPGAFTVNLGDMLQVWSNDRYRSALHRVIVSSERRRQSAPFFLNPSFDSICAPLPELITDQQPAKFRPVAWSHFRDQRSAGDYADYGNEIQIEDFRIPPPAGN